MITPSEPGERNSPESHKSWPNKLLQQWNKLKIADSARLMKDNQRVLDDQQETVRAHRKWQHAMKTKQNDLEFKEGGEDDSINIDSPTTTTQHIHQAPKSPNTLGWILAALGVGSGLGYGGLQVADALRNRPVAESEDTNTQYTIEFAD